MDPQDSNTPLHIAARLGNTEAIKALLRGGASPHLANVVRSLLVHIWWVLNATGVTQSSILTVNFHCCICRYVLYKGHVCFPLLYL